MTEQQLERAVNAFLRLALPPANDNAPPCGECEQGAIISDVRIDHQSCTSPWREAL
jgi:hypothetical protein